MKNILCIFGLLCVCAVLGSCKRIYQITKESTTEGPTLNDILDDSGVLYNDNERHVAQPAEPTKHICTSSGKFCVPEKTCINGKIDKSAGNMIALYSRFEGTVERCNATHVCCQLDEEEQSREDCSGPPKYCVPKETCINGNIDTSAGPLLNKCSLANSISKCKQNEVCCQYGGQSVKGQAKYGEFPWVVQILEKIYDNVSYEYSYLCVGSLVSPNVVLTVAHNVVNSNKIDLLVRAGEWDTRIKTEPERYVDRYLKTMIIHENFNNHSLHFDIAILILKRNFLLGPLISTINLLSADMNFDPSRCIVAGWGKKQQNDLDYSPILKKIDVSVVDRETCQQQLRESLNFRFFELQSSFICAGGDVENPCAGDGGAPLMCPVNSSNRYELAGTLSFSSKCNTRNAPGVFINAPMVRSWISEKTNHI